jgi:flagellin
MVVNNNITSLAIYTSLLSTNKSIDRSTRRLSSGIRINSVKDDPSGMAVANRLRSYVRNTEMAGRNSLDAISIVQTADGGYQEIQNMLIRLKELSVQAANDTNASDDRRKTQDEIDSLLNEIDSLSSRMEYNGIKLLNGDASRVFETSDHADKLNVKCLFASRTMESGALEFDVISPGFPAGHITGAADFSGGATGALNINGEIVEFDGEDADAAIKKLLGLLDTVNLGYAIEDDASLADYMSGAKRLMLYTAKAGKSQTIEISGDPGVLAAFGFDTSNLSSAGTDAQITQNVSLNGASALVSADGNRLNFTGGGGYAEVLLNLGEKPAGDLTWKLIDGTTDASAHIKKYRLDIRDYGYLKIQIGAEQNMELDMQIPAATTESLGIKGISVTSRRAAENANIKIESAISLLSTFRSDIGAYQNRLEYTSNGLNVARDNASASLSRVYDTDMAREIMRLTQENIKSQAAMSIMAQANQRPQQLLQLLS